MSSIVSREKLLNLNEKGRTLVTLQERLVYDVTEFLEDHPGGEDLITDLKNQDVTLVMDDPGLHQHSESAYVVMQEYLIGELPAVYASVAAALEGVEDVHETTQEMCQDADIAAEGLLLSDEHEKRLYDALHEVTDVDKDYATHQFIDLNKPMLMQVLRAKWTKAFYLEQVHKPRHYKYGSAPLFGNFLEPLSLTPWWVIPLVWIPINIAVQTVPLSNLAHWYTHVALYVFGLCLWTLVEYIMHRCLFHLDDYLPENQVAFFFHFLMHGVHHYLPMDRMRLVMPPALMIVLCIPLYNLCHFVFRDYYGSLSIFTGAHMGYVIYDLCHYFMHHKKMPKILKNNKIWHLDHHYKDYQRGFGVTSPFWDYVFGTTYVDTSKL